MNFLFSEKHVLHHPKLVMRLGAFGAARDVPERADIIRAALVGLGLKEAPASEHGIAPIAAVHAPEYLDFLSVAHAEWSKLPGTTEDVYPHTFATRNMTTYPASIVGRAGYHMQDLVAPIGAGTFEAAKASANLAVEAADRVAAGERAVYAVCRPSGHHAYRDMGGGATYLNNAAIAANRLRRHVGRVAVIDIDVHHGNGTQSLLYDRDDVLFISLHRDPSNYWPYLIGYAQERGAGAGLGFNFNLPLPAYADDATYLAALELAAERIALFAPDALVISSGYDAHADDPSDGLRVTFDGFRRIGARLGSLQLPTALIQEGGYNLSTLGDLVAAFVTGFGEAHR